MFDLRKCHLFQRLSLKSRLWITLTLLIGLAFSGCKPENKLPEYTIGFSQCVGSDLWRKTMLEEMKMEMSFHPGVRLLYEDANNDSKKQVGQVRNLLKKGIDILIISPNEAQPLTSIVEEIYAKGIPVIVIDRKTSSNLYTAYVGADNYAIGKMAAEYTAALLKGKGKVIEVMGLPGSSPAIERQRGFSAGIKQFPGISIITQLYGDWMKNKAEEQLFKVQNLLHRADAIFAHNDVMASGVKQVLKQQKLPNVKVIGVDALPGAGGGQQMIINNAIDASLLYPTGGKEAIKTAFRVLNKESFAKENILTTLVIDSSNVQLMKLQWNTVSSQQKDIERQQVLLREQQAIYNNQQIILNITVITLVLAVVFGGLAFYSLLENRKINKSLESKNQEILDQRNQLVEISAKAEMATEAKLNFFTNISHEFRTPLTLILSPLEDLLELTKLKPQEVRNLKLIHKNVFRLLRLVNQLIDYRKIEYEKLQIRASNNNIIAFLKEILESFMHNARKRNIDLRLITSESHVDVWFDVNMLDKVIFNLLSNALKFTSDNGQILLYLRNEDHMVYIDVTDNGIGMTPEEVTHIFDQFYQVNASSNLGSGLGLSLSKDFMRLHHGDIQVNSTKWRGATFTISLQKGESHFEESEKQERAVQPQQIYGQAKIYTTDLEESLELKLTDTFAAIKEHSILIIEDHSDLLRYLNDKFSPYFDVTVAVNGAAGLNTAYEQVPDLIISDMVLPNLSGKELTEKLKADIRTSHIPIILLTAKGSVEQQITGIESLADAYIVKPFHFEYLLATAKNLIRNRNLLKQHYTSDIGTPARQPLSKALDKKFINDFAGIVEQNLANENFSVDDICKALGVSRVQLYRKVKALLDCSITDYILNRRLKKAKYLLINENYSISEITYMVGFSTPSYFSTVFKNKYGSTPSEFKKHQL